ncbi:MAG: recombinase family protein [Bacteroidota bacterium]
MDTKAKTRVYGYARVSTSDQENSLEVQRKRIEEYCQFKHLQLVDIFVDENVSGYTPIDKRPSGSKLIALLNKDVKAVVAIKPDRLFRSTIDALTTIDQWDNMGIELHMVDMGGATLATKTAMGKMLFSVLIVFSQFERDLTGERTSAILKNKKSTGKAYCGSILGYDKIGGELVNGKLKNQKLVPNPDEMEIIDLIKLNATHMSPEKIANNLNAWGYTAKKGGKFFPSTIQNILKNPIYN